MGDGVIVEKSPASLARKPGHAHGREGQESTDDEAIQPMNSEIAVPADEFGPRGQPPGDQNLANGKQNKEDAIGADPHNSLV